MRQFIEYAVSGRKIVAVYKVGEKKGKLIVKHEVVAQFTSNAHAHATLSQYFANIEAVMA